MRWSIKEVTHGIWKMDCAGPFSAFVERGNVAVAGCEPIWVYYASADIDGNVHRAPVVFLSTIEAKGWCETLILP